MFNLQDAMAGSQSDSLLALLGRTLVDEAKKLHVAEKLHSNRVSMPTLLLLSDNELDGLIRGLFPAASLGAKLGFKTTIRFLKESVAPPEGEPISKKPKRSPGEHPSLNLEAAVTEHSRYIQELLALPHVLPSSVADLYKILSRRSGPLPVHSPKTYLFVKDPRLVKLCSPAEVPVASLVEWVWSTIHKHPNNEADSSHRLWTLTGNFLENLNLLAPREQNLLSLESTMVSASTPGPASAALALVTLRRRDFAMYMHNVLILRWENKIDPAEFLVAMNENTKRLKVWSPLYYGELPCVIGGCCGGRNFQWLRLSPKGEDILSKPISKLYDLETPTSLVALLHSIVQMHGLLQKLQEILNDPVPVQL